MSAETIRRQLMVHGKVQGVFFRDSVREKAANEGVAGYAINCDDGTVKVVLEGAPAAVEAVAEYCRLGPVRAEVTSVDETDSEPEGLTGFEIR